MLPETIYGSPIMKAHYAEMKRRDILQVVKFGSNGFPEQIRFGKGVTPETLVYGLGLLRGTEVTFELHTEDPLSRAQPRSGDLCEVRVENREGQPVCILKRVNPLP